MDLEITDFLHKSPPDRSFRHRVLDSCVMLSVTKIAFKQFMYDST